MANIQKIYSDIDLTFAKKPVTGDVALRYDVQAVIASIRNLLLTRHYEKPFNSNIGSNIVGLLFEPMNSMTSNLLEREVRNVIQNFEPRANLKSVSVVAQESKNAYTVTIVFFTENSTEAFNVSILLERTR